MTALKRWDEVIAEQKAMGITGYDIPVKPGPEYYERLQREHQEWLARRAEELANRKVSISLRKACWPPIDAETKDYQCKLKMGWCVPDRLERAPDLPWELIEPIGIAWPRLWERVLLGGLSVRQDDGQYQDITLIVELQWPVKTSALMAILLAEEERYIKRLEGADARANRLMDKIVKRMEAAGETVVSGDDLFFLYATHGINIDVVRDMAAERGMTIDEDGFEQAMKDHSDISRPESPVGLAQWPDMKV